MAINLRDIPQAVNDYLANKVNVSIVGVTPQSGSVINVDETFKFTVRARNANAANGGIRLKNVKYHVFQTLVPQPPGGGDAEEFKATIKVPPASQGISTDDEQGLTLQPGRFVTSLIFDPNPNTSPDILSVGEAANIEFTARADHKGHTGINAKIIAEVDFAALFPVEESNSLGIVVAIEE